jgi:hypothetical protein
LKLSLHTAQATIRRREASDCNFYNSNIISNALHFYEPDQVDIALLQYPSNYNLHDTSS